MDVGTALRALGSPVAACAVVVLALNDHVLKQAWPGWVTGKLSDVAGLVVAPLLLAVLLAACGVRRSREWSAGLVVVAFAVTKTSAAAASWVSAAWSLTGIDTLILADPTDLLALPAVLVALRLWRRAAAAPRRHRLTAVVGLALLPAGVLATAATSPCDSDDGVNNVDVVTGRLSGDGDGRETVVVLTDHSALRIVDARGALTTLARSDHDRLGDSVSTDDGACAATVVDCWRLAATREAVEVSTDAGRTWSTELEVTAAEQKASLEGIEESCGEEPHANLTDVEVLDTPDGPLVVVGAYHAGAWLRDGSGEWQLVDRGELADVPTRDAEPPGRGWLEAVPPVAPQYAAPSEPPPVPFTPAPPTCPPRDRVTVTPHPANGEPFEVCP